MKNAVIYKAIFSTITYCIFFAVNCHAQERGKVEVVKDPKIDTLIAHRQNLKAKNPEASSSTGYRVQVYSGTVRYDAYAAQSKLQAKYPDMRSYITYSEPDFKVVAGDCRTKLEAEKLKQQLQSLFNSLFIIAQKINTTKP